MMGCRETQAPTNPPPSVKGKGPGRELVTEAPCVIDNDDTEMTDSDVAAAGGLTAPPARQRVNEEGKKPVPSSQHRSSLDCNYSQADSEKLQAVTSCSGDHRSSINRIVHQPGHPLHRRHIAATPAMGPGAPPVSASADAGMDVDFDEAHDEVLQVGREFPRYEHENLDSSPDYGRRDGVQGNSRHICKVCSKEFLSGRALGGHMRAHGNGDAGTTTTPTTTAAQQLNITSSSSPRQASQLAINCGAIGNANSDDQDPHTAAKPVVARLESESPENRARARTQREIQSRRTVGARRSNTTNGKARQNETTITPKSSVEDAAAGKQEPRDEEDNAVSKRDHESGPALSSSSDDVNSEGPFDEDEDAEHVCDVCREEFENGKQLHAHKKSHEVYALRSNPKRSRRFIDQDYTECAPSSVPAKKQSTPHDKHDCQCPLPDCPKRFHSSKALYGHMRCHPDRNWRGIHPPTDENGTSSSAAGEKRHRRKKVRPNSNAGSTSRAAAARDAAAAAAHAATSTSELDAEPEALQESHRRGKSPVSEEIESDTESIEAAYMNGDRYQSNTPGWWASGVTGKRSKRSRQSMRSMQAVQVGAEGASTSYGNAPVPAPPPPSSDTAMEELNETALVMMMLASNGSGVKQEMDADELKKGVELSLTTQHRENFGANPHTEEEKAGIVEELGSDRELTENAADNVPIIDAEECNLIATNGDGLSEDGDEKDASQLEEVGTSKVPRYQCNTCKRSFRSHQALGGHRASHKKVKGCFARTNVGDNQQQESHEEETSDENLRSEEQLPTDLNDLSHSVGDDRDRQLTSALRDESSTEFVVHPSGAGASSTKKGAHVCSECGRSFDSGQALGGHKRCHFDPTKKDGDRATSSQGRAPGQQIAAAAAPPAQRPQRPVSWLDLNLPAPLHDEEDEIRSSSFFSLGWGVSN